MWHKNLSNYFNSSNKEKSQVWGLPVQNGSLVGRPQRPSVHSFPGRAEDGDGVCSTMETRKFKMDKGRETKKME